MWWTQTNCFLVLSTADDVHLTYSDEKTKSVSHGPFDKLFIVDGLIHAGEREGSIVSEQPGDFLHDMSRRSMRCLPSISIYLHQARTDRDHSDQFVSDDGETAGH